MYPADDSALLRNYCDNHSHEAFAELVGRHVNLVYSVAVRHVANPHQAEEITQAVFIILAKKAASLRHDKALGSWLFQTTHLTANNFIRSEMRRHHREQKAYMQSTLTESDASLWKEIAPLLDTAVAGLNDKDRRAIVLRFYEGRDLGEVGAALGANEEAAKKRISRALEKLRTAFAKRGVDSTTAAIGETIAANSIQAAPVALAKTVTAVAITKGAVTSTLTLTLFKGALKFMAWTKAKTVIVSVILVLLLSGTTAVIVHKIINQNTNDWRLDNFGANPLSGIGVKVINKTPPQITILPSKYSHFITGIRWTDPEAAPRPPSLPPLISYIPPTNFWQTIGVGEDGAGMIELAFLSDDLHMVFLTNPPKGRFDFIANTHEFALAHLQEKIQNEFGLAISWQNYPTNVLILRYAAQRPPGIDSRRLQFNRRLLERPQDLIQILQGEFRMPVVDETGFTNILFGYPILRRGDKTEPQIQMDYKQTLYDQLHCELVPTNMPIQMLVVEKAK